MSFGIKRVIKLDEYGLEGEIIMSAPTFRRTTRLSNEVGSMVEFEGGQPVVRDGKVPLGDLTILGVLSFVEAAPFEPTLDCFLDFMDRVDAASGRGGDLFALMRENSEAINRGEDSPFVDSQAAETVNSD